MVIEDASATSDETKFKSLYPKALYSCNPVEIPPPGLSKRGMTSTMPFYADIKVILPLLVATVALVAAVVIVAFRWKNSESSLINTQLLSLRLFSQNIHDR